jgi:hypothetical protein
MKYEDLTIDALSVLHASTYRGEPSPTRTQILDEIEEELSRRTIEALTLMKD